MKSSSRKAREVEKCGALTLRLGIFRTYARRVHGGLGQTRVSDSLPEIFPFSSSRDGGASSRGVLRGTNSGNLLSYLSSQL